MSNLVHLRTAAWYGDSQITLEVPDAWEVQVARPAAAAVLSEADVLAALQHPVGQQPLSELARGRERPVIIVDDLTRPTPANRVIPLVLGELETAGISADRVTIIMATGAHGPASESAIARKVGSDVASRCRLVSHDHRRRMVRLGRTTAGTPVHANPEVVASDCVIGIGGIYPQGSAWLGGDTKLALGVLGAQSVFALHHDRGVEGRYSAENAFRRDLDEIARMIGLSTVITLHVDENRDIIRATSGDPIATYPESVRYSRQIFAAPSPGPADVVIANAYPMDTSLTFARAKAMTPLLQASTRATRILVASCPEGAGSHPFFPLPGSSHRERRVELVRHMMRMHPGSLPTLVSKAVRRRIRRAQGGIAGRAADPDLAAALEFQPWVFQPADAARTLAPTSGDMRVFSSWLDVLGHTRRRHGDDPLQVMVYACAPLQLIAEGAG